MKREKEVQLAGTSGRGSGMAGRALHPLVTLSLISTSAANEQRPSWTEASPAAREAPISVWWDYLPGSVHDGDHGSGDSKQPGQ
jgi:hypothetical protein